MTRQPAIRTLTYDCCSALRANKLKQQSGKLMSLSKRSRGTGRLGQHSAWRGFAWDDEERR